MSYEVQSAKRYREQAEELRAIAGRDDGGKTRDKLLDIAADYERIATNLEAIDRSNRGWKKS